MNRILSCVMLVCLCGCGNSQHPLNTAPLTDEQKAAIRAEDDDIDRAEKAGSGTATKGKK